MQDPAAEPGPSPDHLPLPLSALTQPPALHGTGLILLHDAEAGGAGPGPGPLPGLHSSIAQPVGLLEGEVPGPWQAEHACKHKPYRVRTNPAPMSIQKLTKDWGRAQHGYGTWKFPQLRDITARWGLQAPQPTGLRATLLGCARKQSPLGFGLGLAHASVLPGKQRKHARPLPKWAIKWNSAPATDTLLCYSWPVN